MTQAPERIWVEKSISEEGNHGSTAWPEREDGSEIEYVRADLTPAVKPLEWTREEQDLRRKDSKKGHIFEHFEARCPNVNKVYNFIRMTDCAGNHRTFLDGDYRKPVEGVTVAKKFYKDMHEHSILSALTTRPTAAEAANGLIGDLLRLVEQPERHAQFKDEIVTKAKSLLLKRREGASDDQA